MRVHMCVCAHACVRWRHWAHSVACSSHFTGWIPSHTSPSGLAPAAAPVGRRPGRGRRTRVSNTAAWGPALAWTLHSRDGRPPLAFGVLTFFLPSSPWCSSSYVVLGQKQFSDGRVKRYVENLCLKESKLFLCLFFKKIGSITIIMYHLVNIVIRSNVIQLHVSESDFPL